MLARVTAKNVGDVFETQCTPSLTIGTRVRTNRLYDNYKLQR